MHRKGRPKIVQAQKNRIRSEMLTKLTIDLPNEVNDDILLVSSLLILSKYLRMCYCNYCGIGICVPVFSWLDLLTHV